ncbi:PEP-CTERM sorting domain-containing protein [Moorena producens]|uniref:PEP-CTERM sorting domain-containing protein n=1 Tax=Moorena producens TaxID=1155739 RepID=UPI003C786F70
MSIKHSIKHSATAIAAGAIGLIGFSSIGGAANAATIINGGFEEGFRGWRVVSQTGSYGGWSTTNGTNNPDPSQGSSFALSSEGREGSHVLFQDIVLEAGSTHELSFDWFTQNHSPFGEIDPETMDFNGGPNQHFRVDLVSAGFDDWFSPSSNLGVLANIVHPFEYSGPDSFKTTTFDLTPWAGSTVRLAFRQVSNIALFNAGVDAVSIKSESTSVPEPASVLGLLAVGVGCVSLKTSKVKRQKLKANC